MAATAQKKYAFDGVDTLGDKIIFAGGRVRPAFAPTSYVETFDPKANQWSQVASMSVARQGVGSATLDGKFYVFGGSDGTNSLESVEIYDSETNQWTDGPEMPETLDDSFALAVNGEILLIGGSNTGGAGYSDKILAFSPVSGVWRELPSMENARAYSRSVLFNNELWVIGGMNDSGALSSVDIFDLDSLTWSVGPSLTIPKIAPIAWVSGGRIYIGGGTTGPNIFSNTIERFNPAIQTWESFGNIPEYVTSKGFAILDDRIFTAGGQQSGDASSKVYAADLLPQRDLYFRSVASKTVKRGPTSIFALGDLNIAENRPIGTIVGEFTATDPDGDEITFHFGVGDNNNSLFSLDTNGTLKTATVFEYESNDSSFTIRVQAKDEHNVTVEGNFTVSLHGVEEGVEPSKGDGTSENPYEIANLENLRWLSKTPSVWFSHFIQTQNIDATDTRYWNDGKGFKPIGELPTDATDLPKSFNGFYDGDDYIINNLTINRPEENAALFNSVGPGATLTNVRLFGAKITGRVAASIVSESLVVNYSRCESVAANIIGSEAAGGLVGIHDGFAFMQECFFEGNLTGETVSGGLIASAVDIKLLNSYAHCLVNGSGIQGGLVGELVHYYPYSRELYSSNYSLSNVPICGNYLDLWDKGEPFEDVLPTNFWNSNKRQSIGQWALSKNDHELKSKSVLLDAGWDLDNVWRVKDGSYPKLRWQLGQYFTFHLSTSEPLVIREGEPVGTVFGEIKLSENRGLDSGTNINVDRNDSSIVFDIPTFTAGKLENSYFAVDFGEDWNLSSVENLESNLTVSLTHMDSTSVEVIANSEGTVSHFLSNIENALDDSVSRFGFQFVDENGSYLVNRLHAFMEGKFFEHNETLEETLYAMEWDIHSDFSSGHSNTSQNTFGDVLIPDISFTKGHTFDGLVNYIGEEIFVLNGKEYTIDKFGFSRSQTWTNAGGDGGASTNIIVYINPQFGVWGWDKEVAQSFSSWANPEAFSGFTNKSSMRLIIESEAADSHEVVLNERFFVGGNFVDAYAFEFSRNGKTSFQHGFVVDIKPEIYGEKFGKKFLLSFLFEGLISYSDAKNIMISTIVKDLPFHENILIPELNFFLTHGDGDSDNALFDISDEGELSTGSILDFEDSGIRSIRVGVSDSRRELGSQVFMVTVVDAEEDVGTNPPNNLSVLVSLSVPENREVGFPCGSFTASDPDGDDLTFHFVSGENNNSLFSLETNGS